MSCGLLENYTRRLMELPTESIVPNFAQPRTEFDTAALDELAESIRNVGIIQPLTVRYRGEGMYELIAGERRLRAAKQNGLRHVPCVITDIDDSSSALIALVENLQRRDLDFFEQARGLEKLISLTGMTQAQAAEQTGKTQSAVANKLRLLKLPESVRKAVAEASLTERHARALLTLKDEKNMLRAVEHAKKTGCTVSQFEHYIIKLECPPKRKPVRMGFCRDLRLYSNSFAKTVRMMNDSGFSACIRTDTQEDKVTYTITVRRTAE